MTTALVWISGASSGIGLAMAKAVPWDGARVIGISRRPAPGTEHLAADLADPASWPSVGSSFRQELDGFDGARAVFVHAAGTLSPIGFAGEVDTGAYCSNVVLNSAASQVLGHMFLQATAPLGHLERHLVMITSGAAHAVYAGWSSYGAGKAGMDQWVRAAGAEQAIRGGVQVLAVAPGIVDTGMQEQLGQTAAADFPARDKFVDLRARGGLADPDEVAERIWSLLESGLANGAVLDLRHLATSAGQAGQ